MPDSRSLVRVPLLASSPLRSFRSESGCHVVYDEFVLTAGGGSGPEFNYAVVFGPVAPERVFASAGSLFDATDYAIVVESESAQPMEDAVRAGGWRLDQEEPALVLSPIPTPPPPPAGLTIRLVVTEEGFTDFMALSQNAPRWIPSLQAALDPAVALFVGYYRGEPVATSRVTCYRNVGDINGVVTVTAYRRRGFGTAMT